MKKFILSLSLFLTLFTYGQVNYCDSIEISITSQTSTIVTFSSNIPNLNIPGSISYDWTLTDESGTVINSSVAANVIFSLPNPMNSDTNYICLTNLLSNPVLTITCTTCDTIVWNGTSWMLLSMMPPPCNLTGGSVYIDNTGISWMMNATVNGMSQYTYVWSNGGSANQIQFYTSWCVTITDIITGCDTTICQGCIPDTTALCACIMIYAPVCGCDGNQYPNYCVADCAGVSWTPAIPSGMPGGFLPCNSQQPCIVEINNGTVDIEICDGDTTILEATTGFDTYLWTLASTGSTLGTTHIIEVTDPGLYIVIVTDSTNCVDMDSIEVIVYPLTPLNLMTVPNPPEVCVGDSVVIEVTQGLPHYYWNTLDPLHQDENRIVVYPTQDFLYVVEALDSNGCESREEILVLVDTCATGMHSEMFSKINIYPNPTSDKLYIDLPENEIFTISVLSMEGKLILQEIEVLNSITISTEKLTKGSYILKIENDKGTFNRIVIFE